MTTWHKPDAMDGDSIGGQTLATFTAIATMDEAELRKALADALGLHQPAAHGICAQCFDAWPCRDYAQLATIVGVRTEHIDHDGEWTEGGYPVVTNPVRQLLPLSARYRYTEASRRDGGRDEYRYYAAEKTAHPNPKLHGRWLYTHVRVDPYGNEELIEWRTYRLRKQAKAKVHSMAN